MIRLAHSGALAALPDSVLASIVARTPAAETRDVATTVRGILEQVRDQGDAALRALTRAYDGVDLEALEVPRSAIERARAAIDPAIATALERAKRNLERVHTAFLPVASEVEVEPGVVVGRRPDPLAAVGIYAPGGRAAYPSSVLMGVVPAAVAGVGEIVVCSPPGPNGAPSDVVLAAAAIGGATKVFAIGGAQAIAALAYGTETVVRVDRIVGPGNAFVAEAKRQVAGRVGIDAPAGPSEILVIADDGADPAHVAREMVAQAEHDPEASCVALAVGEAVAAQIARALAETVPVKADIVRAALGSRGAVLSIRSLAEAWPFASAYAAEHLLLAVRDPEAALENVRHAGTVFLGDGSSVAFGDYLTGGNHVLPTAGAARSFSGLSTGDFFRWSTWQRVSRPAAAAMAEDVGRLARAEGLPAHAVAAEAFREEGAR
jgi:histidinol dehydrogenase